MISPQLQRERIEAYAAARGFDVELLEPELDVSGGAVSRPILDEILAGVEADRYGGVIVAQLDRLSRLSLVDAYKIIERVESAGGLVVAVAENFDATTPEGELGRNVMLSIGRMQRRRHADAFAQAKQRAVERGIWPLPIVPIGYQRGAERQLEPSEAAPLVLEAFKRRASGESWPSLGRFLDRGPSGAMRVLRNRVYLGEVNYGLWRNPDAHPALVDVDLYESAQLRQPRRPRNAPPALLAGLLRCAACRGLLTPARQRGWVGYRCMGRHRSAGPCPAPALIAASIVEPYVERVLLDHAARASVVGVDAEGELRDARDALSAAEAELEAFQRGVDASGVEPALLRGGLRMRARAVEHARRKLGEVRSVPRLRIELADAWPELDVADRGQLLRGTFGVVWVKKGRGPAVDRVKVSMDEPADLPRPGFGRSEIRGVEWDRIEAVAPQDAGE